MRTDGREMLGVGGAIGLGVVLIRMLALTGLAVAAVLLVFATLICAVLVLRRRWRRLLGTHKALVRQPPKDTMVRTIQPEEARLWTGLIDPPALGIAGRDDVV
ncbi:MAG: hypothetical protein OHK0022_53800 [Roseiflexaceae bacterium]